MHEEYSRLGNCAQKQCADSHGADSDEQWLPHDWDGRSSCETNALGWSALSAPTAGSRARKRSDIDRQSVDDDGGKPTCAHRRAEENPPPLFSRVGTPSERGLHESEVTHEGVQPGPCGCDDDRGRSETVFPDLVPEGVEDSREVEDALTADDWFETTYALFGQAH